MDLRAVFFDVGETLVDETGVWGRWADWLGVPRLTFAAVLGAVVARGDDHREVFSIVRPDLDFDEAVRRRGASEQSFILDDLYPDAASCLRAVQDLGLRVGIAANQPARAADVLRESGLPFDWLLISELEGLRKPDPRFFDRILEVCGLAPESIVYVGDRVDNDVVPAANAGMVPVHVRRGPWGVLQEGWPGIERAALRVPTLEALPARLAELVEAPGAAAAGEGQRPAG